MVAPSLSTGTLTFHDELRLTDDQAILGAVTEVLEPPGPGLTGSPPIATDVSLPAIVLIVGLPGPSRVKIHSR